MNKRKHTTRRKPFRSIEVIIVLLLLYFSSSVFSQGNNQNQVTIRDDRVILLNGQPFFPIGVCCENQGLYYQLINNGFNFINLFTQNHFLYSDSCGFNSKNIISGDVTTSIQYQQLLQLYANDLRWDANAHRIFNYMQNDKFFIFGDDFTFYPDDINDYIINTGSCGDSIHFQQNFNQTIRNESVNRLISMSNWQGNKLIGVYAKDDANMFQIDGPYPTYYYDNFFTQRVNNFKSTYDALKRGYPNSLVMMSIPNTFFPRAMDPQHWQNVDTAREHWISDALQLSQSADILFCPGYTTYEWYSDDYMIYNNKFPSVYPYDLENTVFGRVLKGKDKAAFGGLLFDELHSIPDSSDTKALLKLKWHIYVGLEKGCTGLIFFGWHKYARPDGGVQIVMWNYIRSIINEMVNTLHLNDKVFVKTNSGQIGHTISGSNSNNISYAVYKIDGWKDYYLLVTNNPNGSLYINEADNSVKISHDPNMISWDNSIITEVFSNQNMHLASDLGLHYTMPCYGTALFHIQQAQIPDKFSLSQNYPNPFNPATIINYQLPVNTHVKLVVYDVRGRVINMIVNKTQNAGMYNVEWNGTNYSSGVYFYMLTAGNFSQAKKMVLVK